MFTATMREVVFLPYWDVPTTIARTELVPRFRRTPSYFVSEGFEIVRRGTSDVAATTFPPTAANLARVASGDLRIRQRPGPANALGFVKFVFPNRYNVFVHDTPTRDLFARARRDFSHGCIRVARPNALAEFALHGQAPWNSIAVDAAMQGDRTLHVPLARPISVYILYATATAGGDGTVSFYPDLYYHDATLERLLGRTPIAR
jgi:murein L,D-transpeptidase YcbB/YkuD